MRNEEWRHDKKRETEGDEKRRTWWWIKERTNREQMEEAERERIRVEDLLHPHQRSENRVFSLICSFSYYFS